MTIYLFFKFFVKLFFSVTCRSHTYFIWTRSSKDSVVDKQALLWWGYFHFPMFILDSIWALSIFAFCNYVNFRMYWFLLLTEILAEAIYVQMRLNEQIRSFQWNTNTFIVSNLFAVWIFKIYVEKIYEYLSFWALPPNFRLILIDL